MQFTNALIAAVLSATALAAPTPAPESISMMAQTPQWTITEMRRNCTPDDVSCIWSFNIDTHTAPPMPCSFEVKGSPASRTSTSGKKCGAYTVNAGWDGSFGEGEGFTVMTVVDYGRKEMIWPSYLDKEFVTNLPVSPDKSYQPTVV